MAHSPTEAQAEGDLKDYRTGWKAMFRLMKEGLSWSGREANCVFLNLDGKRFADVSGISGANFKDDGRGLALVDWDHDGALDVWTSNRSAPQARFLHNRAAAGRRYAAFRLRGAGTNTDGIGARVELVARRGEERVTLLRTLHAGDGYLTQSTKWVHFGLGAADSIERVAVRWPDGPGEPEVFTGATLDAYQVLEQGSGRAARWERPARTLSLAPGEAEVAPATERARVVLAARPPLPPLDYETLDGAGALLGSAAREARRPLLVNLWASWCAPCVGELKELTANEGELRERGLDVLALSVDEPDDRDAARALLEQVDWPFGAGFATLEVLDALDLIQRSMVSRRRRLPVPTSFLVTPAGEISAIYKGPLEVDVLLADLALADLDEAGRRYAASPLPGTWLFTSYEMGGVAMRLVRELRDHDFTAAAGAVLLTIDCPSGDDPVSVADRRVYLKMAAELAERLVENGEHGPAARLWREMVALEPDAVAWWQALAESLEASEELDGALAAYRHVLERRPRHPTIPIKVAVLLLRTGAAAEAVPLLEKAVQLRPDQWRGHWLLGRALAELGRIDEARTHVARSLELNPEHDEARAFLER